MLRILSSILNGPFNAEEALHATPPASWYQTYAHLSQRVAFFLWHSLAPSTRTTYRTGQKSFTDFIILYPQFRNSDSSLLPASQSALLKWVSWLGAVRCHDPFL